MTAHRLVRFLIYVNPEHPSVCSADCPLFADEETPHCVAFGADLEPASDPALADEWWYERAKLCKLQEAS